MTLWMELKIGHQGNAKPLIEVHMEDLESVAQIASKLQELGAAFGLK